MMLSSLFAQIEHDLIIVFWPEIVITKRYKKILRKYLAIDLSLLSE